MNDNPNLVFCRGCGQPLHVTAPTCPHCGAPQALEADTTEGDGIPRTFGNAVSICFSKYATFRGRAPRAEYWWFSLFNLLIVIGLRVIAAGLDLPAFKIAIGLAYLVFFLPGISVTVRRLHDVDRSGWWFWITLVPLIGSILLLVWFCTRGTIGPNRFGPENGGVR